jgi:methylmalonyl-CoA/ethylmalonyl-CoA epimerase
MFDKIDHIGIAVEDLNQVLKTFKEAFDIKPHFEEVVQDQMVNVAGFNIGGSTIEYLEPTDPSSPIAKFLDKKGTGIHHMAFRVQNLAEKLVELKEKGIRLIDEVPREGAEGKKIAFIHPKSTNGILIELCEL